MSSLPAPVEDIEAVAAAHRRLLERIEDLSDDDMRKPSLLPDWSVGHVLTHVARNADSHVRRAEAAVAGVVVDQYPGGYEARAAEIEAGSSRPADVIIEDVRQSALAVEHTWQQVPDHAWSAISRDVGGRERELRSLPSRRWQEAEVHLVDLAIGATHRDWSDEFVSAWLPQSREQILRKLEPGAALPHFDDAREELAWLYGRLQRDDLHAPPAWG
ncbi:MAG: maleylpyruvate isomerase N-terminal domain-containing protein [Acidimicrobiia bacterium]|nr:maleylpyruvate isomerase N-terminal domain-containing protein [Acidimicrobiia bacterium]